MNKLLLFVFKPKKGSVIAVLVLLLSLIAVAGVTGYLSPIIAYLDSEQLSFKVGAINITVYQIIQRLISVVIILWLANIASHWGEKNLLKIRKFRASNRMLMVKAYQITLYFVVFMMVLHVLNIDFTALTVLGGAIGIGIGFGLQKIASNFISGLILLFEKSIETDDMVELSDGTLGVVKSTQARHTLIATFDGREIMVPNEEFIINRVTNWTYSDNKGRVEIKLGVAYGSDIEQVIEIMEEAARLQPRCIHDPKPQAFLTEFGNCSVNFTLYFWVADVTLGRNDVKSDTLRAIWKKFNEHKIEIPFPKMDITIQQMLSDIPKNAVTQSTN